LEGPAFRPLDALVVTGLCALTSALWRVVGGAQRRRVDVAHQRVVRAWRLLKHLVLMHDVPLSMGDHSGSAPAFGQPSHG
jgi:hypothetical protein